jgi:hypothetical protein
MTTPSQGLLRQTAEFWKRTTQRDLTLEEARQAIENISGFFQVLAQWDSAGRIDGTPPLGSTGREAA